MCLSVFLYWSSPCVSFRLLDSSTAPSELWMVGEHLSPVTKQHDHQMMADVSRSWRDSHHPSSPVEKPDSSPGCGARAERQERRLSRAGDEEQQRAEAGWEGFFTAEQEPPSASRSEGSDCPQAEGGSRSNDMEANPGEDGPPAERGGREDSEHLATSARQHTTVFLHHSSSPLFSTSLLLHSSPSMCSCRMILFSLWSKLPADSHLF